MSRPISRRTALRGLGSLVALPALDSLARGAGVAPAVVAKPPRRVGFIYVPNGKFMEHWTPAAEGPLGVLPDLLKPLDPFKSQLNVLSGLTLDKARANGDGGGDHARAMSAFLTGRQPRKTHGADIRAGVSADQHIANAVGDQTRFASLELGVERGGQAGNCDSGYSCAYSSNLSWRGEATPNAKEVDPKLVFDRLFGGDDPKERAATRAKRDLYNRSVLDFVLDDARSLSKELGQGDRGKLDEYLSAVREVEQRIEKAKAAALSRKPAARPDGPAPAGVPKDYGDHVRLMCDLMVLAYRTDLSRVVTLPFANDGSNRSYPMVGVGDGHHSVSHHQKNPDRLGKIKKINTFHTTQLAYLLGKLRAVQEVDGSTLLDNTMLVYGSGIGDGDRHNHEDLPILLAGGGGGTIAGGRHLRYAKETPLMNLYLSLFDRVGAGTDRFGDSTGRLKI